MLRLDGVVKQFSNGFMALDDIHLTVEVGEIVSLVGTSGCGKSTLLRIIAGLDVPTLGQVWVNHQPIASPQPEIGMIFQEPRLMPWLTVYENVQFGLAGLSKAEKEHLTYLVLERVGLTAFAQALPRQLSGGMAQRVAIARALITKPSILLLDEPFSALDAFIRMKLQDHLLEIWQYDRPTLVLVTHDIEEALVLSDRVIVLRSNPGRIHQEFVLDLPRPRKRTDLRFQQWKERLLNALDLTADSRSSSSAEDPLPLEVY
ncbi:ABC transporter ATP-binding protein [Pantanalinema sp. GBBB05]|uniref:ABC transporter ATP-binding protein n=1 Tax=Pantanalinema sp. GBBB05 TaxID=2604139 RepID=UPI001D97A5B0|nr:ABC transporter ATP-binding protein [Pantanalinema sp. GBBB05]